MHIAALSYGLYLVHKITIHLTQVYVTGLTKDGNLMLLLCMVTAVAGALLLNLVVEKPFLRLRKNILRRKNRAPIAQNTYTTKEA